MVTKDSAVGQPFPGTVPGMVEVESALDAAGLKNPRVREYVAHWAAITQPDRIEVVSAEDDARLVQEALDAGELQPAGPGRYYSRSYHLDTARSEERTVVATGKPEDRGVYNNWKPADEMTDLLVERMRGASAGKTMYVIPYLMSPPGNALTSWAWCCARGSCSPPPASRQVSQAPRC